MTLGRQLEVRRRALGLRRAELADRAGYSPNTVGRVLRGENVRLVTFCEVAAALGVRIDLEPIDPPPASWSGLMQV